MQDLAQNRKMGLQSLLQMSFIFESVDASNVASKMSNKGELAGWWGISPVEKYTFSR